MAELASHLREQGGIRPIMPKIAKTVPLLKVPVVHAESPIRKIVPKFQGNTYLNHWQPVI